LSIQLARQPTLGPKPQSFVLHAIVLDGGLIRIGSYFKRHEVSEVFPSGFLKLGERGFR
jgi:hypothetical protein